MIFCAKPTKLLLNNLGHPPPGPDFPAEPEGRRPPGQQLKELAPLLVAQLGWPAGWLAVAQGWDASLTSLADPLAYRASGDTQGRSHILLFPTLLDQLPSPQPAGFLPIAGGSIIR